MEFVMKKWFISITWILLIINIQLSAQVKRSLQPEDLYRINRVSDPRISPDGKWIVYTITVPDLETNGFNSDIWLIPSKGGSPEQLTFSPHSDHSPRWSPDGSQIAFISSREEISTIWLLDFKTRIEKKLTDSKTSLSSPVWTKDGQFLICRSRILPEDITDNENPFKEELPLCDARTINHLLFRQWDRWLGDKRNHLFLISTKDGSLKDIIQGDFDTPPVSLSSHHDFDISPDGSEVCFVRTIGNELALSTNHDLFSVSLKDGRVKQLTQNPALDFQPHYSPDGRWIAYCAMTKPGYESDTKRLALYNRRREQTILLTEKLDLSVWEIVWHPNSQKLFFTSRDGGRGSIYSIEILSKKIKRIDFDGYATNLIIAPDGRTLVFIRSYCHQPNEIYRLQLEGRKSEKLTFTNEKLLEEINLPQLEEFWFTGAEGTQVHAFLMKPPFFNEMKKYPVVLTIHGGPQNMWTDRFMTTWFTFPLITSPGYVGIYPNPRGSIGYGARFREEVSRDYGGKCFEDLMACMDYVIENYDFVDPNRTAAIGGSFGGYSVNWIMGHTDRFSCIVSHAGLYNIISFFGATEELWYPVWDMGKNPWDDKAIMEKWSPHNFAINFKTPCLVTHGELDYRVPVTESFQLFTALQLQGVPSRLVYFPDEGHVISTPQNNVRWWKEIHRWFENYLK
jgi:dipeptidyl aminopeptidase/acylaminoacyl peptidase